MKLAASIIVALATLSTALVCDAADLVLREQATQHGPIIRLGDIADIAASSAMEVNSLASTPLLPAPAPGTRQFLNTNQVRDLLLARGVQLDYLTITGAKTVELGSATATKSTAAPQSSEHLTVQQAEQLVRNAILDNLQASTDNGHWRVEVTLSQSQADKVRNLDSGFVANRMLPPRSGRQRFVLGKPGEQRGLAISAIITKVQSVVVAINPIERGQLVRRSDVAIREREGNIPRESFVELDQVVGKSAQRSIRPDTIVQQSYVRAPWQVRRGDTVSAFVRTGGISIRTRAIAKQDGAMGDLIMVETLGDKQRLDVTVSGPGEVTVYATGGRATDYASLNRNRTQR